MATNAIIIFIVFNILNVVIQTIKSIATIKCGKNMAAIINAIAYGLYTYIVVLTASDGVSLWLKIVVVALANLVGVWVVKFAEEKGRKDKLWKVEATVRADQAENVKWHFEHRNIPYNYIDIGKYVIFNAYCQFQSESAKVKEILNSYDAKYFVSESKTL
jgi:hypothetical protein